ncbi:MAG: cell surface protein SprA [Flavobacteriales bacterium]|nr:cell surface protein SprA [Flavobacteriales bacterium]
MRMIVGNGYRCGGWYFRAVILTVFLLALPYRSFARLSFAFSIQQVDSPQIDLVWPLTDDPAGGSTDPNGVDLGAPSNIENDVIYDPVTGQYILQSTVGGSFDYRPPMTMSLDEYLQYDMQQAMQTYWMEKSEEESERATKGLIPQLTVKGEAFDRIFGGNTIDIRPQGSAEITFGVNISKTENPRIPVDQRRITTFDFDQKIQLNLTGNIGDKLKINTSYNTEATFDFENQVKLDYTGYEDEIIQKVEAGNVSLPLQGSLIQGSQSLFGIKTELKFGRLTATAIFSQEKGQRREVSVAGGAQTNTFDIKADEYEANKYFFLSYYFRDRYEDAMRTLPTVNSGIQITRIEVWVTNTRSDYEQNRNIVAFTDLGEDIGHVNPDMLGVISDTGPGTANADNGQNSLYTTVSGNPDIRGFVNSAAALQTMGIRASRDYEKLESARMLQPNEYTLNERLGFIGLNQSLNNDEVLAVAYEYIYPGGTGKVGEFSTDGVTPPQALMLKLLKATVTDPRTQGSNGQTYGLWDLMMKNVYSLGAFQVNADDFRLDIIYNNPSTGVDINYVPRAPIDQSPLLQVLGLDRLDPQQAPNPDGWFDYVDGAATTGGTINSQNGRVFFPLLEPFGRTLHDALSPTQTEAVINTIAFQQLYDSTKTAAQNLPELNRFRLKGSYKSASSDVISLNAVNIPQGSVVVTAGGVRLVENQDYTVDYNLGRVKILNQGILESGTPINISLESNSLFSIQTKTLGGLRLDYKVNKDLNIGGTFMTLYERPLTQKVNVGDEPIRNTILGLDANWQRESNFITTLVDKLPFYATKEVSSINASAEAAYLIPGHSKAIGSAGTSYIDDFEGSVSTIDLRTQSLWFHAATPQGQPDLFPEGEYINDLRNGFNRAKLAWYVIDPLFFRNNNLTPSNVTSDMQRDHRMREVLEQEVFPNRQLATGTPTNIPVLDLAYYPRERGPYNYDTDRLDQDGYFSDPQDSWAGITRRITTTDFEASNIETIQFWMMDPFAESGGYGSNEDSQNNSGGDLYLDLGNISEDVLRDSRKSFENGLPKDLTDGSAATSETTWGVVPNTQSVVNAFAITDQNSYKYQDVGLDGLSDSQADIAGRTEQQFFSDYLTDVATVVTNPGRLSAFQGDPSGDDYKFFRAQEYDALPAADMLLRYKEYNGLEGNSVTDEDSPEDYPTQATTLPSTEDINQDQNLSESESYFQYKVDLRPEHMVVGENYITDRVLGTDPNSGKQVYWYQFKVPIRDPDRVVNGIQDFRSIRFMRMFLKDWSQEVVLRFARLEFVRGEWRKYDFSLETPGEGLGGDPALTTYETAAVNIEENGNRTPINYVVPPGINQEVDVASTNLRSLNEQSLQLTTCNLRDGDARASFRNVSFDIRSYKKLQMFIHAESSDLNDPIEYGDVSVFIRLGNDFDQNYYEYEVPVRPSELYNNDPYNVWPEENDMIVEFARLNDAKIDRNKEGFPVNQRFLEMDGDRRVWVKGNPNLSQMKTIMIGIRNPKKDGQEANPWQSDDGQPKCVEVWVNELRLTDFDQRGGWAALARVNTTLADLGTLSVAGNYSTPGWGSIDKRVSERQRETDYGVDVAANLEMGKFLPESSGVKVPMYVGYSEQISNPQYDPLNPDIEWNDATRNLTAQERKEKLKQVRTYTRRRSINFTNVHRDRPQGKKEHLWDVENLSLSYGYNDQEFHDVNTEFDNLKQHRGSIAYVHNPKPIAVKPFENISLISKSKWLKLIKEFNFNVGFKQVNLRTAIDRSYQERLIRPNPDIESLPPSPTYNKSFNWTSQYGFRYELTKSLRLDFNANNRAIIGEPPGRVDPKVRGEYAIWKDSVLTSLTEWGETTNYDHTVNVTYQLPFDKFPVTDWITANTSYAAGYQWDRAPFQQDSIGNTIQNSQNITLNGQLNFVNLYNKVKWLKKINDKTRSNNRGSRARAARPGDKGEEDKDKDKGGNKEENKFNILETLARMVMAVRNGNVTYSQNSGTLLPGYGPKTNVIGMDNFNAPGFGFVLGQQNHDLSGEPVRNIALHAADEGWLVQNGSVFTPYTETRTETINGRLSIEPLKSLRIDLSANRTYSENRSSFIRYNDTTDTYHLESPREYGNFSVSIITWATTFSQDDDNFVSPVFSDLLAARPVISERLGAGNLASYYDADSGYYHGYYGTSQDVVIPAFIAAYTGRSAGKVKLDPFKMFPLPNWDITYDGLSRTAPFSKWFRTFTINHSYRSSFNIGSYQTNLQFDPEEMLTDAAMNFIPERQIGVVTISEVMRPFINFDMTLQNSLLAKFEYNRDRNASLSLSNYQVTEVRGKEYVIGLGYRFKNVKFPITIGGNRPKSDVNLRVDLSWRQNNTVIRKIAEQQNQVTAGQDILSIKASVDYVISQRLNVRAFYERVVNKPVISTSFPSANTNIGLSLRFTLTQ